MNQDSYNNDQNTTPTDGNEYGKEPIINCPKCGQPMKISARCCIHCGELNYLNNKNDSVKPSFNLGKKLKEKEERKIAKSRYAGEDISIKRRAKRYLFFRRLTNFLIVVLLVVVAINYKIFLKTFNDFRANYYLKQVDKMVEQVKEEIDGKSCISSENNGKLNYSFYLSSDYFKTGISLYTFDYFSGNIQINKVGDDYEFIISITDGKYGFKNENYEDLDIDSIKKIGKIDDIPDHSISCE